MIRRPPVATRTCTLFPSATLCRSISAPAKHKSMTHTDKRRFSVMNLAGTDALGRRIEPAGKAAVRGKRGQKKHVGLFYSLWLGQHHSGQRAIYDIQHLLNTNPEDRKSTRLNSSH